MSDEKRSSSLLPMLVLAIGIVLAAGLLGSQLKNLRQPGMITVKGLAEDSHRADTAEWQVGVHIWYPDYAAAVKGLPQQLPTVVNFLKQQGFSDKEYVIQSPDISTYYEEKYENDRYRQIPNGFTAKQNIIVTTSDLDKLEKAHSAILALRAQFDVVRFEAPQYLLSNLEAIKQSLIAKATEDAHRRAQEFAKTGNGKVTAMRSASQGSFNILSDNISKEDDDSYGGQYDKSTINKRVRLVVTIQYGIE